MKAIPIALSEEEREELLSYSRANSLDHRLVSRARLILALDEGLTYEQAAVRCGLSRSKVSKWKRRFMDNRIDGLFDQPRSGRPLSYSEVDRARVIQKACEKPTDGHTNLSQRAIAKELKMSQSTVCRLLAEDEVRPHKIDYWCGRSPDPEFEEKMLDVVGLYLNPPENALVLSVDEKTQIQALERSQPELPLAPGLKRKQTVTYKRHGTASLVASLAVHTGEVIAEPIERNNAETFLNFLKKLDRTYTNVHLHIIVDNLQVHKSPVVANWLARKRKITMHFTPTYSSWLNQIEIWFSILTKDVLKGAVWTSKEQLIKQIMLYIETYNREKAKPFSWTYDGRKQPAPN